VSIQKLPLPSREGVGGRGNVFTTQWNSSLFHPHPNPPPSRGREFGAFLDGHYLELRVVGAAFSRDFFGLKINNKS